ncbi:MAG: UvrD-helicase domain-containing protein [Clostridia bacterium]|nr:UvrD-helicase domain-containing protein [Clostridia bacterium]
MAERRWTDEQLAAINTRDKTLLVSAAAGSGKTATLTERIIRSLLDKEHSVTIDSLLIVTYTNAAASELRQKIGVALEAAVKENPDDEGLLRQLMMLPSARIKTIDAFCNDLLKNNAASVGLSPRYRISTGAECEILSSSILEGLIDAVYSGDAPEVASPEEFDSLAECLTDTKHTEDLSEVLKFIYDKCQSSLEGTAVLSGLVELYDTEKFSSVDATVHGKYIIDKLNGAAEHYIHAFRGYRRRLSDGTEKETLYIPTVDADIEALTRVRDASGYEEKRRAILDFSLTRIKTVRDKTPLMDDFSAYRKIMREDVDDYKRLFIYTTEEWRELYGSLHTVLATLCKFLFTFDRLFMEEKRQRGIVSYSDLERYTYNILWRDGERTDIAKSLADSFSQIYIDEYQDVNALQDKIFEAVSKPNNRFMVGDIKQSIYGFRSARPEIFARMKATYPDLANAEGDEASIFMSKNFRCDKGIIDFTNCIFDKMFGLVGESIGYQNGDRLEYAKLQEKEPPYRAPKIILAENHSYSEGGISAEDAVAYKIKSLLAEGTLNSGERIKPSDIAIIFRTTKALTRYSEALSREGIPTEISVPEDFFLTPEVLLTLSFLYSIDNPRRDVYLAGLMCSPIFNFEGSELAEMRLSEEAETLYESLVKYTEAHPDYKKGREFLERLNYYRSVAEGAPVDRLIYRIYHETGLLSLASRQGGRKNLMFLYDHARSFESGAFRGLYNFLTYIDNIISGKISAEFDERRAGSESNAVKLITAHSSKGLEYPVVFFVHANKKMAGTVGGVDSKERWVSYSEQMGVSLKLRTPSGLARVNNPVSYAITEFSKEKDFEEELRVLYVILTRAREQLFVVGESPKKDVDEYKNYIRLMSENLTDFSARGLSTYLDVALAGTGGSGYSPEEILGDYKRAEDRADAAADEEKTEAGLVMSESLGDLAEQLERRFTFEYSEGHMTVLPEKMSVSRITPTVLDGADERVVEVIGETIDLADEEGNLPEADPDKDTLPKFMTGTDAEESAKRGIATHYFMQFCDLPHFTEKGAEAELKRLVDNGFLSEKDGERVRVRELEAFRRSALLRNMLGAKSLYRELRFNLHLPAKYFTEDEEKRAAYKGKSVLVQGVIDCIWEDEDGDFHLVDYKTDRLTWDERKTRSLAEARMREAHTTQLSYYALAIREMLGKTPKSISVYSLHLGDEIKIENIFEE